MGDDLRTHYIKKINSSVAITKTEAIAIVNDIITEVNRVKVSKKIYVITQQAKQKLEHRVRELKKKNAAYKKAIKMLEGGGK